MNDIYFVTRVFFKKSDGSQSNSIQAYDNVNDARKRFYSILASDIASDNISYELVQIVKSNGMCIASEVFDYRENEVI